MAGRVSPRKIRVQLTHANLGSRSREEFDMQTSRTAIAAVVAAAVLLSGCGSSRRTTSTAPETAPNASSKIDSAFVARADAVCARASKGAVRFPYRNFDPLHPDVKLLPKVGAFFAKRQAIADAVPKQLRQLGPPATGRALWTQMLTLATRDRAVADRQIKAAEASDGRGFVATVNAVSQTSNQLGHLAVAAGFSSSSPCRMIF
jgi:hypothetical protein